MKKISKLFVAVAVLFAGYACTTDTTEDLGVTLGDQTTLTLSLAESRTQLGSAVAGLYPVTWSEDDQISVNGTPSKSIVLAQDKATATFTFDGVLSYPYQIAYPAAAAGKVTFAEQQNYVEGTFDDNAAVMYGYAESAGRVTLNYLTGVLKIGVTGNKTLSYAQISTIDRAPIAGTFALDFTSGEVEADSASTDVIGYSFGEGLALTSTAQYLHIAVPAGIYDELYLTLYDTNGGVMYATVRAAEEKPLVAGKVREFVNTIAYVPDAEVFVIRDVKTLKEFAEAAPTLEKEALFVADIDMTDQEWTPIKGVNYKKNIIGNGYAIKGLTAPLFDTLTTNVKGLHFEDVKINETVTPRVGALARHFVRTSEATQPVVENCSVSGTVNVACAEFVPSVKETYTEITIGGLLGQIIGAKVENCTNHADITVSQIASDANTVATYASAGGIAGAVLVATFSEVVEDATVSTYYISESLNCDNYGDITYSHKGGTASHYVYVAGAFGNVRGTADTYFCTLTNGVNRGAVTINGDCTGEGQYIGGYAGILAQSNATNLENYGAVTINGGAFTGTTKFGGLCGWGNGGASCTNCHNYAPFTVNEGTTYQNLCLGGFSGGVMGSGKVENCSNSGAVYIHATSVANCKCLDVAGFTGYTQSLINNSVNHKSGTVTVKGTFQISSKTSTVRPMIGGIVGYKSSLSVLNSRNDAAINVDLTAENATFVGGAIGLMNLTNDVTNSITNVVNTGAITVSGKYENLAPDQSDYPTVGLRVGGVIGHRDSNTCNELTNTGDITIVEGTNVASGSLQIGGLMGTRNTTNGSRAFCNIKAIGQTEATIGMITTTERSVSNCAVNTHVGGSIQVAEGEVITISRENYLNYICGSIPVDSDTAVNTDKCGYISSIDAEPVYADVIRDVYLISTADELIAFQAEASTVTKKVELAADIDMTGKEWTSIENYAGTFDGCNYEIKGLTAPLFGTVQASLKNIHLTDVNMATTMSGSAEIDFGCLACQVVNDNAEIENCSASGELKVTCDSPTKTTRPCGLISLAATTVEIKNLVNKVNITITGTPKNTMVIAGCVAYSNDKNPVLSGCQNLGNFKLDENMNTAKNVYLQGVAGLTGDLINCVNGCEGGKGTYGTMTVLGKNTAYMFVGGVNSNKTNSRTNITNCVNYGNIEIGGTRTNQSGNYLHAAGISGNCASTNITGCTNYGDIICSMTSTHNEIHQFGGIYCGNANSNIKVVKDCVNYGKIEFTEECSITSNTVVQVHGIGRFSHDVTNFENVRNEGAIVVNSKSISAIHIGGISAQIGAKATYTGAIANKGAITVGGNCTSDVYVGGIVGNHSANALTLASGATITNSGAIECNGTFAANVNMGGIFGLVSMESAYNATNIGALTYTGTGASAANIGGFAGSMTCLASDATVHCDILAVGANVGMLTGSARQADVVTVSNAQVGGRIATELKDAEDADGNSTTVPLWVDLKETNYFDYLYGGTTDWTGVTGYDGCSFLSVVPTI